MTAQQVVQEVLRDEGAYRKSGGGVTLSGGESTAQPAFLHEVMDLLREKKIHIALDSCGFCKEETFCALAAKADLILFDLKHADPEKHKQLTGQDNRLILKNLDHLEEMGARVEIRIPLIPTMNDDEDNLCRTAEIIRRHSCIERTVLLGYHPLGQTKIYDFDAHGRDLGIEKPAREDLRRIAEKLERLSGKETIYR